MGVVSVQPHAPSASHWLDLRDKEEVVEHVMRGDLSMAGRFHAFMQESAHKSAKSVEAQGAKPLHKPNNMTYEQALDASKDVFKNFYQQILKMIFAEIKRGESDEKNAYQSHMVGDLFVERLSEVLGQHVTPEHERMANAMLRLQDQKNISEKGEA